MTTTVAPTGTLIYQIDPTHSSVRFSVRHMMISHVRGDFSKVSGTLTLDTANPSNSHVEVEIGVDSINTGQPQRDEHLRTGDFFELEKYPTITFASTSVNKIGDEEGTITGDLTIHGVTKEVTLTVDGSLSEVNDLYGNLRLGFEGRTKIKRGEFGLTYNAALETGGVVISDEVAITIDVQFVRTA